MFNESNAITALAACFLTLVISGVGHAREIPELDWSQRSDWINVKDLGAIGDGQADDTAAIQKAMEIGGRGKTLYFPPGTYRLTSTLQLNGGEKKWGRNLIGHGATTVLRWDGEADEDMVVVDGNPYSRVIGLVLDGQGVARHGFYHVNTLKFETNNRYKHVMLKNLRGFGIGTAWYKTRGDKYALSEPTFENCVFINCEIGLLLSGHNDYDWQIAGCDFIDCGYGIHSTRGVFYLRDSFFSGSRHADVYSDRNEHGISVRRCVSKGSKQFMEISSTVASDMVEDCYVSNWTGENPAITKSESTLVVSNTYFEKPGYSGPAIQMKGSGDATLLLCNNTFSGSGEVASMSGGRVAEIPAGEVEPVISRMGGEIDSFLLPEVQVSPKIFDATAEPFNAIGDGKADDTQAIQACIDAAREAGGDATAYLPNGSYRITSSLIVTGAGYRLAGNGPGGTFLAWDGEEGGDTIRVVDPQGLIIEDIAVGYDRATSKNFADIRQTSTFDAGSSMVYNGVYTYGKYQKEVEHQGLVLQGLGKNDVVNIKYHNGNLRFYDSADATILGSISWEGHIVVDDTRSEDRSGLIGFLGRLSCHTPEGGYGLTVRSNNSIVMTDWYTEQSVQAVKLSGDGSEHEGRVSIRFPKMHFGTGKDKSNAAANALVSDQYRGTVMFNGKPSANAVMTDEPQPHLYDLNDQDEDHAISLWFIGMAFSSVVGEVSAGPGITEQSVGCRASYAAPLRKDDYDDLSEVSLFFDDFLRVGRMDLTLNHPHVIQD